MSTDYLPTSSDGWEAARIVVSADDLMKKASALSSSQANGRTSTDDLVSSIVPASAFGNIQGGPAAAKRLRQAIEAHLEAITTMGVSVSDFAARVKAAGELADQVEPATVKASRIPDPFTD